MARLPDWRAWPRRITQRRRGSRRTERAEDLWRGWSGSVAGWQPALRVDRSVVEAQRLKLVLGLVAMIPPLRAGKRRQHSGRDDSSAND